MTTAVAHQEFESRADLEMSYKYWRKMKVKIGGRLGRETRSMIVCFRIHLRLLNERKQMISLKSPFNPMIKLQLVLNKLNAERVKADLDRHRVVVKTLRQQIAIAIKQRDDVSDELEILTW
jgi:hypothetical protein